MGPDCGRTKPVTPTPTPGMMEMVAVPMPPAHPRPHSTADYRRAENVAAIHSTAHRRSITVSNGPSPKHSDRNMVVELLSYYALGDIFQLPQHQRIVRVAQLSGDAKRLITDLIGAIEGLLPPDDQGDSLLSTSSNSGPPSVTPSSFATSAESAGWMLPTRDAAAHTMEDRTGFESVNQYVILEEVGRGTSGKVMMVLDEESNEVRAIKIIEKQTARRKWQRILYGNAGQGAADHFQKEVAIMRKLKHRHIVPLLEVIADAEDNRCYLVMPYYSRGTLLKLNAQHRCAPMDLSIARGHIRQLLSAVQYLHNHNIVHRDIKPENILLGEDGNAYLSDFGCSAIFGGSEPTVVHTIEGTPTYFAPELFSLPSEGEQLVTLAAKPLDIWALGVTFYLMVYGQLPFHTGSFADIRVSVTSTEPRFDGFSIVDGEDTDCEEYGDEEMVGQLHDLLRSMLTKNPATRPCVNACRRHPFFGRGAVRETTAFSDSPQQPTTILPTAPSPPPPRPRSVTVDEAEIVGAVKTRAPLVRHFHRHRRSTTSSSSLAARRRRSGTDNELTTSGFVDMHFMNFDSNDEAEDAFMCDELKEMVLGRPAEKSGTIY